MSDINQNTVTQRIMWRIKYVRRLTTHCSGARIRKLSSARLTSYHGSSRPLNSGVRLLFTD